MANTQSNDFWVHPGGQQTNSMPFFIRGDSIVVLWHNHRDLGDCDRVLWCGRETVLALRVGDKPQNMK